MATSLVLDRMVNSEKESREGRAALPYSPEVGEAFVNYIYKGNLDTLREPQIFLEMGEKYDIQELKDLAEKEMIKSLRTDNMVDFFEAGRLLRYVWQKLEPP